MGGLEPPTSRTMRSPLSQLSYISLCFSDCPTVNGINNKPFPMGCLSIVASSLCSSIDIIGFCTTASMQIQLNHRPLINKQRNSNRIMGKIGIEPIMFTTRERIYSPLQHRQSLPLSQNPDSRVSNMFIVLCFPLSCFPLRRLQECAANLYPANVYD